MNSIKNITTTLVLFALCRLSVPVVAEKQGKQNVMLILDASGSMWGKINGQAKIDIARGAVSNIVNSWNKNTKIGVMAYGHRRKGDCSDIQTLVPIGVVSPNRVISMLNDINPKGKTPLGSAIKIAASSLKTKEEAATVILLSDGLETCGMDPCTIATQLKKDNINFRAHVIGFDVKNIGDISKLKCIAQNTGGRYFTANNTDELNRALGEVKKVAVKEVEVKTVRVASYDEHQLPSKCKKKRTMFLRNKSKIDGIKECMKIIIKSGGDLTIDGIISDSIYIVENGGKLNVSGNQSSVDVFVKSGGEFKNSSSWIRNIENDGGNFINISGDIKKFRMKSGTAIIHDADIDVFEMDSGTFTMYKGDLGSMQANSGTIKLSSTVDVDSQSGNASVELIAPKSK